MKTAQKLNSTYFFLFNCSSDTIKKHTFQNAVVFLNTMHAGMFLQITDQCKQK